MEAAVAVTQSAASAESEHEQQFRRKYEYDAFISYRRSDAGQLARWIRNKLQRFRLPAKVIRGLSREKRELYKRRPQIWLDTSYEKSSDDFLLRKVFPALNKSARMIVVSTPAAFDTIAGKDGQSQDNWLVREIDHFLGGTRADLADRPVDLILGPGALEDRYPGRLAERLRWDWIDLRGFNRWRGNTFSETLDDGVTKLIAALYDVPDRDLPVLRQEERRRRQRTIVGFTVAGFCIAALTTALAVWGFVEQSNAFAALQNALTTRAQMSIRLATEELSKNDPDHALAAALAGLETPSPAEPDQVIVSGSVTAISSSIADQTLNATLRYHSDSVLRAIIAADSTSVMTVGADSQVVLWHRSDEHPIRPVRTTALVGGVFAANSDGSLIASASQTGQVAFWTPLDSKLLPKPFTIGEQPVMLALSDESKLAAVVGARGNLVVWNLATDELAWSTSTPAASVSLLEFGHRCDCLAVGTNSGDVLIWHLGGEAEPALVRGASGKVTRGVFDGDGKFLFSTDDRRIWRISEQQIPTVLGKHDGNVIDLAVSSLASVAASASVDGTVFVWDLRPASGPNPLFRLEGNLPVTRIALSYDGGSIALAYADGTIAIWDISDLGSPPFEALRLRGHTGAVLDLSFTPDGNWLVSGSSDRTARIWRVQTASRAAALQAHEGPAIHVLARGGGWALSAGTEDKTIHVWSGPPWKLVRSVVAGSPPSALAISADGRHAFIGTRTGDILQWATSGTTSTFISRDNGVISSITISPDQKTLAAIGVNAKLQICRIGETTSSCEAVEQLQGWGYSVASSEYGHLIGASSGVEGSSGEALVRDTGASKSAIFQGHTERVSSIRFDHLGQRAVTASWDGTARIWDLGLAREVVRLVEPKGRLSTAGFSPDGEWIATCSKDTAIRLWKIPSSTEVNGPIVLEGHESILISDEFSIGQIEFDPTGSLLVASLASGDIKIWHIPDGLPRALLKGDGSGILRFSFQPDGSQITATTARGRLLSWSVPPALTLANNILLPLARSIVPLSGSLAGKLDESLSDQAQVSQTCPYDSEHHVGLPPHRLSGASRARQHLVLPTSCGPAANERNQTIFREAMIAEAEGDFAAAARKFRAAADAGNIEAAIGLGDLDLVDGFAGDQTGQAADEYARARKLGAPSANSRLGWLFLADRTNEGVDAARAYFTQAVEQGDADGFAGLAWIDDQHGTSRDDFEAAFSNYVKAQYTYEVDGDFIHALEMAEQRSMLSHFLPPARTAALFLEARHFMMSMRTDQR
ncbi:hypothetical protein [Mesorhizobium sp. M0898]|uniref:hypothetical protein n=1 Tax=Mesorhizobium sp. M0898 TaxID=2957020 RepID=UPI00333C39E6